MKYENLFEKEQLTKGVCLRLLKKEENCCLCEVRNHILGLESNIIVQYAVLKFSYNSKYMAIFLRDMNQVRIIRIPEDEEGLSGIQRMFDDLDDLSVHKNPNMWVYENALNEDDKNTGLHWVNSL